MSNVVEIKAENLGGESITEGVIKVLKAVEDHVERDEVVFVIETDKTSLEIAAPETGKVVEICIKDGDSVTRGQLLAKISTERVSTTEHEKILDDQKQQDYEACKKKDSPAARKIMSDHSIDPAQISGSGKDERITKLDVLRHLEEENKTENKREKVKEDVSTQPGGQPYGSSQYDDKRETRVKMTKIRQVIAQRLKKSQNTAAILTTFNEIDMKNVIDIRNRYKDSFEKKYSIKLGFMSFFVKAVIEALKEVTAINSEILGDEIIYKHYYDIGIAVGTNRGLVVPVLRNADNMFFSEIELALSNLGKKAREGKLEASDLMGATFTISNGGVYGSLFSTPIINPPQSGILGMHAIQNRPVVVNNNVEIRPMMYVALSYDHRIVDGQGAVTFLVRVKEYIEDLARLLLHI